MTTVETIQSLAKTTTYARIADALGLPVDFVRRVAHSGKTMTGYFQNYDEMGERKSLIPSYPATRAARSMADMDRHFSETAETAIRQEERVDAHRDRVLSAAIGVLKEITDNAERGINPDACFQAASVDLMTAYFAGVLQAARISIAASGQSTDQIDAALAICGVRKPA